MRMVNGFDNDNDNNKELNNVNIEPIYPNTINIMNWY